MGWVRVRVRGKRVCEWGEGRGYLAVVVVEGVAPDLRPHQPQRHTLRRRLHPPRPKKPHEVALGRRPALGRVEGGGEDLLAVVRKR